MFACAPDFDYSHFSEPILFEQSTDNPTIPPRLDLGENFGRLAFISNPSLKSKKESKNNLRNTLNNLDVSSNKKLKFDVSSSKTKDKKRRGTLSEAVNSSKSATLKTKEKREKEKEKEINKNDKNKKEESISSDSKTAILRDSNNKRKTKSFAKPFKTRRDSYSKVQDNKTINKTKILPKSTYNLSLDSITENIKSKEECIEKLKNQEQIVKDLEKEYNECNDDNIKEELKNTLEEQITLLTQFKMHVKYLEDYHFKGCLQMRIIGSQLKSQNSPWLRYYFFLNYPRLCCYDNEEDEKPSGAIPLSSEMEIFPSPTNKCKFSIKPPESYSTYEFIADTPEDAMQWKSAICKAASIPLGKQTSNTSLPSSTVAKEKSVLRRVRSVLRIGSSGTSQECKCFSIDEFMTWTDPSSFIKTTIKTENDSTAYYLLSAGTLTDFFFWVLFHFPIWEASNDNLELSGFFLIAPSIAEPNDIVKALLNSWTFFEENGFPPEIGANGMKKRLFYIIKQWFTSDVIYRNITEEIQARNHVKEFCSRVLDSHQYDMLSKIDVIKVLQDKSSEMILHTTDNYVPTSKKELIQLDSDEISQQLTISAAKLFSQLTIRELLNYIWFKIKRINANEWDIGIIENILKDNDTQIRWVITTILQAKNTKEQVSYFKKFYRIAKRLYDIKNYNNCSNILSGLLDVSVQSIQELRDNLSVKYINRTRKLAILFSPLNEYSRFKSKKLNDVPCIPFLNYELEKLISFEELHPPFVNINNNQINYEKMSLLKTMISESKLCKPKLYDYTSTLFIDNSIQLLIQNLSPLDFEELNKISISREPTRMAHAVLELEIAERDAEINQLRQQLKKQQDERNNIISELKLSPDTLKSNNEISCITCEQLNSLLTLLANERMKNNKKINK